jgi:hypothetical protein
MNGGNTRQFELMEGVLFILISIEVCLILFIAGCYLNTLNPVQQITAENINQIQSVGAPIPAGSTLQIFGLVGLMSILIMIAGVLLTPVSEGEYE